MRNNIQKRSEKEKERNQQPGDLSSFNNRDKNRGTEAENAKENEESNDKNSAKVADDKDKE